MSVRAPAERNFRRARIKPGKRRRFRPVISAAVLRRALILALFILGLYQVVTLALTAPLLRVDTIAVKGNVRMSSGQVQALVDDLRGSSILRLDLETLRSRLVDAPWVAEVALRRVLPSTVEVFVSERRPIGLCRMGEDLYLVDSSGVLIDQFGPQYAEFDLPIIDGLVAVAGRRGEPRDAIDPVRAELASRVITALGRDSAVARRLSQVDVSDASDAVVLLDGDGALLHLGEERFLERIQSYLELAGALRERVEAIDYVDLRFEQRVYVRPAAGGSSPADEGARAPAGREF